MKQSTVRSLPWAAGRGVCRGWAQRLCAAWYTGQGSYCSKCRRSEAPRAPSSGPFAGFHDRKLQLDLSTVNPLQPRGTSIIRCDAEQFGEKLLKFRNIATPGDLHHPVRLRYFCRHMRSRFTWLFARGVSIQ